MSKKPNFSQIQDRLKVDKNVVEYDEESLKYLRTPIGKASYDYEGSEEILEDNFQSEEPEFEEYSSYEYSDAEEEIIPPIKIQPRTKTELNIDDDSDKYEWYSSYEEEEEIKPNPNLKKPKPPIKPNPKEKIPVKQKKKHHTDKIVCSICGGTYARSGVTSHRGTKKHQIYEKANRKFLKIMQD